MTQVAITTRSGLGIVTVGTHIQYVVGEDGGGAPSTYRLLDEHWVNERYLHIGQVVDDATELPTSWRPTADVEPLNIEATRAFYNEGPRLPAVIRTHYVPHPVPRPVTYWYQVSPNMWALSGLGSDQTIFPPKLGFIGRIE